MLIICLVLIKVKITMSKKTIRTLTQYIVNQKDKNRIRTCLFDYAQLENLLIHLLNSTMPKKGASVDEWKRWKLLNNRVVMKAVLKRNTGGEKTQQNIADVMKHFGDNYFLKESIKHCTIKKINGHNASMLVTRVAKDFQNSFDQLKKYRNGLIKHFPGFPKAKRLRSKVKFSLPFESSKFSIKLKKQQIFLNFFSKREGFYFPIKGKLLQKLTDQVNVSHITVGFVHSDIYVNLGYHSNSKNLSENLSENPSKSIDYKEDKYAGLDIGIKNLCALFIDDQSSQSLIYSGKTLIRKNVSWNRQIAKIQSQLAEIHTEKKDTTNESHLCKAYKKLSLHKQRIFANRRRSFQGQFEQISALMVKYLKKHEVTHLVMSKNLSFAKQRGEIKQNKKSKQTFYQIPFGSFLNILQRKCIEAGIEVKLVDEAWTSKTSILSDDVNLSQSRLSTGKTGYRGVRIKNKSHRGLYLDKVFKVVYNADLGAAVNHIRLICQNAASQLQEFLFKICNPKKIKSTHEFGSLIKQLNS